MTAEPIEGHPWPLPGMQLCERCRLHYHPDEMEPVELDDPDQPELWCSWCRQEPSGWAGR